MTGWRQITDSGLSTENDQGATVTTDEIKQSAFDATDRKQIYMAYSRYKMSEMKKETNLNASEWAEINLFFEDNYRALELYSKGLLN